MDAAAVKPNPLILPFTSLESLGGKIPSSDGESKMKSSRGVVDESDEEMDASDAEEEEEEEEEPEIVESDVEIDESDVVEPDNEPPQKVEVSEENRDAAQEAKIQAMEAISEGKPEEAIEHLTTAILLNPTSAIMHATRASVYIKMKKPNAAVRDANAALEINPDCAKGYKSRGIARAMLGQWEEAAKDLHVASKLDYDEEISAALEKVEPNAHKLEEHRRKYDRLRKEREEKKAERERLCCRAEAQAAYEKAKKQEEKAKKQEEEKAKRSGGMPGGFPGGMPGGGGGMPGGGFGDVDFAQALSDPETMAALHDPKIMTALCDLEKNQNPTSLAKHRVNPNMEQLSVARLKGQVDKSQCTCCDLPSLGTINCAMGLKCGSVLVGVDSRGTKEKKDRFGKSFRVIKKDHCIKITEFPPNVVMTSAGSSRRNQDLKDHLRDCKGLDEVVRETESFFVKNKLVDLKNQIGVLIVGYDTKKKACVVHFKGDVVVPTTDVVKDTFIKSIGTGSSGFVLDRKADMSLVDAIDHLILAMLKASFLDIMTGGNFIIWLVSENKTREARRISALDAIIKFKYPELHDNFLMLFSKAPSSQVNSCTLLFHFANHSYVLKGKPTCVGKVDGSWTLFLVDMKGAVDCNGVLVENPAKSFFEHKCKRLAAQNEGKHAEFEFLSWNEQHRKLETVSVIVMLGSFNELESVRKKVSF